ncbi:34279_t:CDS:2, partial [Racocetra persica]
ISKAIHDFFHQEGFYYVPTPIITGNDAEGAGEVFKVATNEEEPFFSQSANLTVSGQLHAEALAQRLGKVYTFAEMTWADLTEITDLAEKLLKYTINYVLANNEEELAYLEKFQQKVKIVMD